MAPSAVVGAASMKSTSEGDQGCSEASGGNGEPPGDDRAHRDRPPQKVAQVIRMRRQMQRERKEMLAELRPLSAVDRPGTPSDSLQWHKETGSALSDIDYSAEVEAVEAVASEQVPSEENVPAKIVRPVPQPRATTQSVLAKVNRAHKGLVRREVWRQKFDFLYKLVQEEMKEDKSNPAHSSTANAAALNAASSNPASASALGNALGRDRLDKLSSSMFARYASAMQYTEHPVHSNSHVASRPSSASHSSVGKTSPAHETLARSRSASTCSRACTAPAGSSRDRTGSILEGTTLYGDEGRQPWLGSPSSHNIRGGWCKTGPLRPSNSRSRRRPSSSACQSRGGGGAAKNLCSEALPRLLSGSSSLPLLSYKAPQSQSIWSGYAGLWQERENAATMEEQDPREGKGNLFGVSVKLNSSGSSDTPDKVELMVYTAVKKKMIIRASVVELELQPTTGKRVSFCDEAGQNWALQFPTLEEAASLTTILQEAKVSEQLARELCGIRDDYYKGNERFMHEDILHCSNPDLFPLCTNPDVFPYRPFPLRDIGSGQAQMCH